MTESLLQLDDVTAGFGATTVLHGVSLEVASGEVAVVFGLNGAGKSVTVKVVGGLVPVRSGRISFKGTDVSTLSAEQRVHAGMAHVPQARQVFGALTVDENLRLGAYTLRRRDRRRYSSVLDGMYDRFSVLAERRGELAGSLSGGQQASLAVARALMAEPTLLLIDEPSAGLAPMAALALFDTLKAVAASGVTMLLVEQNVPLGLRLADTVHVMQVGRVVHRAPVAGLDESDLAHHLGVGRLLRSSVSSSLGGRSSTDGRVAAPARPVRKAATSAKRSASRSAPEPAPANAGEPSALKARTKAAPSRSASSKAVGSKSAGQKRAGSSSAARATAKTGATKKATVPTKAATGAAAKKSASVTKRPTAAKAVGATTKKTTRS